MAEASKRYTYGPSDEHASRLGLGGSVLCPLSSLFAAMRGATEDARDIGRGTGGGGSE